MTEPAEVFTIEPEWRTFRYLFDNGETLDVLSPYRADSNDRERVLAEAARRFGKRAERKIVGVATLGGEAPDARPDTSDHTRRKS